MFFIVEKPDFVTYASHLFFLLGLFCNLQTFHVVLESTFEVLIFFFVRIGNFVINLDKILGKKLHQCVDFVHFGLLKRTFEYLDRSFCSFQFLKASALT